MARTLRRRLSGIAWRRPSATAAGCTVRDRQEEPDRKNQEPEREQQTAADEGDTSPSCEERRDCENRREKEPTASPESIRVAGAATIGPVAERVEERAEE